jgi:capsular exopolysaccharide synthesis family protein
VPAAVHFEAPTEFSDDLKNVIDTLRRRSGAFLLGFLPVLGLAICWIYFATPHFTATATVLLDPRTPMVTSSPEVLANVEPNSAVIDTQVQLIESRVVLGRAVDALDLEDEPAFAGLTRNRLIDLLKNDLDVSRVGLSYVLRISFTDVDAEQAARVSNAIADAYLTHQLDEKLQATKDANQWLYARVGELKQQVETAEAAVEAYRSHSGLLVAQGSTSTETQLTNLDLGLNQARQDLSNAEAQLAGYVGALDKLSAGNASELFSTPMMEQLRAQYTLLANQRAQQSTNLGPQHPQMVELNLQVQTLQQQMNAEAQRTIEELKGDIAIANNRVAGLLAIRDQSRAQLGADNAANVELTQLQTDATSLRMLYEAMLARLTQTTSQETLGQVNARVVSEAVPPNRPAGPGTNVILAAAGGVGLAFGALAVLLAQIFDGSVVRPEEFERRTRVPVLALVPRLRRNDLKLGGRSVSAADVVLGKPMSLFTESFRSLRVAVLDAAAPHEPVVIQMTSGTFAEGKTLCSIAFARTAAMDGMRVLLIDADVRRQSLTQTLGINTEAGLIEVLRGEAEFDDVIVQADDSREPHVLPLSARDPGPHDLFSTEAFDYLLDSAKRKFDVIVIDSAPVLALAEPLSLAKHVDIVVLIAMWAKTPIQVVVKAVEEISRAGGHVAGTLLTHVNMKKLSRQSYGRGYYPALTKYYQR